MSDTWQKTLDDYKAKGFAERSGFGSRPALMIVDFINGFTDPATPLGGDFSRELAATRQLLSAARRAGAPVVYTTIAYEADFRDAGIFIKKAPSLSILRKGSSMVEIDPRIRPAPGDQVIEKKFASAFFGTDMDRWLKTRAVDTVIMAGCTTSGCIRASAIDAMQYGYLTVVVRDAVGDRPEGTHEANLYDIDAKYGDVVALQEALDHLGALAGNDSLATRADEDFQRWWQRGAAARAKLSSSKSLEARR